MQSAENKDLLNQFMEIMKEQNMSKQAQEVNNTLLYIVNLQAQMMAMTKELQEVKEQLNTINATQANSVSKNDIKMISGLQTRVVDFSEQLGKIKNSALGTIKDTVNIYKTKGKESLKNVLAKGLDSIKSKLQWCRNTLLNILNVCKEANRRLDAIGNELAQIGYSVGNIGKIALGKEMQPVEVSNEKGGVALTRIMKAPINKAISFIEKQISKIDIMVNKIEQFSERLNPKESVNDKAVEAILNNAALSVADKTEQLINIKDNIVFNNDEEKFIMSYADKVNDIHKVHQLIEEMVDSKNTSLDSYSSVINKAQKEMDSTKSKDNSKESVLNKLHSNQEKVKNNETKGEERIVKRDELQK